MLSYKEYKLLNESLYNLGIRTPEVISEPIGQTGGTEAALEEAKAKKCMKMKKGMEGDCGEDEEKEDEDMEKDVEDSVEDSEDHEEEGSEDSEEKEGEDSEDEKVMMMKKKMKKKSKKEWSELESDLDALVEDIENPMALIEVKKGIEMIKKGMKKCNCSESEMSEEYKSWWQSVNSMLGPIE